MKSFKEYTEALTRQQRRKVGLRMKRLAKRIARKKKILAKRMATPEKLLKRARKAARKLIARKILKGRDLSTLTFAEKEKLEKRLDKKKAVIARIARKLLRCTPIHLVQNFCCRIMPSNPHINY